MTGDGENISPLPSFLLSTGVKAKMTINEVIDNIDARKIGNQFERREKIAWLNQLDGRIKREIIDRHEGAQDIKFEKYDENTNADTKLLASGAYEDLYIYYLEAMIDRANQESEHFNNDMIMFNSVYTAFARDYNRRNMPKETNIKGV